MYAQSPKSSKDLLFLEEALANITELLRTLNSKIEEIDLVFVLAVQNGESAAEDSSAQAQERQMKRAQLVMLKENIDVISDNLKALIARSKQKGAALFDVAAIEAVISEAATLLVLLNSEEEDEAVDQSEEFITDVQNIDQIVAQIEDEVTQIPAERMRSATVARDGFTTEPVTELDLRPSVFDPRNPNKRPEGWANVQMKRVLRREQTEREEGIDEDTIAASRKGKEDEVLIGLLLINPTLLLYLNGCTSQEDAAMVEEVKKHGKVLGLKAGGRGRSATLQQDVSNLDINADNFKASDPTKRPVFWSEVRIKRVMLKEHIDRIAGVSEAAIADQRPTREIDVSVITNHALIS